MPSLCAMHPKDLKGDKIMNTCFHGNTIPEVHKYDIWFAALPGAAPGNRVISGPRPVVVVSADESNQACPVITVVPLTSHLDKPQNSTHALITANEISQLECNSRALAAHISTIDKSLLRWRIGRVDDAFEQLSLQHAMAVQLGLTA